MKKLYNLSIYLVIFVIMVATLIGFSYNVHLYHYYDKVYFADLINASLFLVSGSFLGLLVAEGYHFLNYKKRYVFTFNRWLPFKFQKGFIIVNMD